MRHTLLLLILITATACSDDPEATSGQDDGTQQDSGTDTGTTDEQDTTSTDSGAAEPDTESADYAFLLPISNTQPSWHDLAFLATIPTASKLNHGRPVVIAAEAGHH